MNGLWLGAGGAGDSMCRRRVGGASGLPLKFTARPHA